MHPTVCSRSTANLLSRRKARSNFTGEKPYGLSNRGLRDQALYCSLKSCYIRVKRVPRRDTRDSPHGFASSLCSDLYLFSPFPTRRPDMSAARGRARSLALLFAGVCVACCVSESRAQLGVPTGNLCAMLGNCNGHGRCNTLTKTCTCYEGYGADTEIAIYKAPDCSQRTRRPRCHCNVVAADGPPIDSVLDLQERAPLAHRGAACRPVRTLRTRRPSARARASATAPAASAGATLDTRATPAREVCTRSCSWCVSEGTRVDDLRMCWLQ